MVGAATSRALDPITRMPGDTIISQILRESRALRGDDDMHPAALSGALYEMQATWKHD